MENKNLIPFVGIKRQYQNLRDEILDVTDKVYSSGKVLDGEWTHAFETAIASYCDRDFAISVNSGTQGLIFALQSIGDPGPVLIPSMSFVATVNSVVMTMHTPEFVDVDFNGLMDLENHHESLRGRYIAGVMYANLFGNIIDYDKFRVLTDFVGPELFVIEDAAQSFGARYKGIPSGKLGTVSVLSFDPMKNLPNYGSGGMVLTDDFMIANAIRDFRDNGKTTSHQHPGTNSKMSEVDCAQMLVKLKYFDEWQERRHAIATYYSQQLVSYMDVLGPNEGVEHAWHKFVVRTSFRDGRRDSLKAYLAGRNIETKIHYTTPLDQYPVSSPYASILSNNAYDFSKETLSLPIYPELTDSEVEYIAQTVKDFYR